MHIENKLRELGFVITEAPVPLASYVPGLKAGEFVFISGQLPIKEKQLIYRGKLGRDLTIEEGQAAAELAAVNCIAVLKSCISAWADLLQIVKLTGYIQSADYFEQQAAVLNGASKLLETVFGEKGKHARAALGVNALPLNAACEIEMIARVRV